MRDLDAWLALLTAWLALLWLGGAFYEYVWTPHRHRSQKNRRAAPQHLPSE